MAEGFLSTHSRLRLGVSRATAYRVLATDIGLAETRDGAVYVEMLCSPRYPTLDTDY
jgi:hypothetical protein